MDALIIVGVLFAIALTILWICLPFAVFGVKAILNEILKELRIANGKTVAPAETSEFQ